MDKDLRFRVISAAIGIPIVAVCLYQGGLYLLALLAVVILFSQHEFFTMARRNGYKPNLLLGYTGGLVLLIGCYASGLAGMAFTLTLYLFGLFCWQTLQQGGSVVSRLSITLFGTIYIGFTIPHIYLIRGVNHGEILIILIVAGTWLSDTAAYFFGTKFGRHRFMPSISPNKSLEGSLAAIAVTVLFFFCTIIFRWMQIGPALLLGLAVGLAAQLGDVFESLVKRDFEVKDSGRIIPGHGGFLDRFDSLIFSSVVAYYVIHYVSF